MHVVVMLVIMTTAQLIAHTIAAIFYDMHHMMFAKQRKCPKDARLVNCLYPCFQFHQRQWALSCLKSLSHKYSIRRWLHSVVF